MLLLLWLHAAVGPCLLLDQDIKRPCRPGKQPRYMCKPGCCVSAALPSSQSAHHTLCTGSAAMVKLNKCVLRTLMHVWAIAQFNCS